MAIQDENIGTFTDWAKQAASDAVRWSEGTVPQKELDAYGEGYRQGFMKAVQTLKLHDLMKNRRA